MDRIWRLGKSKSSRNKIEGSPQVHKEKNMQKLASPSLVARLMGLDGLPPQRPIRRQQKNLADNNIQKTGPTVSQRDARLCDGRSNRMGSSEQPEFKDVFEDETDAITTRIVILKPNYAKTRSALNSFSSPDSSHANFSEFQNHKENMNTGWANQESYLGNIDFSKVVDFSRSKHREAKKATRHMRETSGCVINSRELTESAKKFNREIREVFDCMMIEFPSCVRELPGTGGLYDFSGIDTANESEVMKMTSYDSTESFVSRQAKKKLLERWKKAQTYHDVGVHGKGGSTLGEMLSIPDSELRGGTRNGFDRKSGTARWDNPLGISSRDAEREFRVDDKLLIPKEAISWGTSKAVNGEFNEKEDFSSKKSRSSKRKSQSCHHRYANNIDSSLESQPSHDQMEINPEKNDPPEEQPLVPKRQGLPIGPSERVSIVQCSIAGPTSSESSKEGDHPSPVSVLEVPREEDDVSSVPESFDQVSAGLRELRKQLQLLKEESKSYAEVPTLNKSDNDFAQGLIISVEDKGMVRSECWESSYIDDVLTESGFNDTDPDMFMTTWNSPDCPLGTWVFDNLEKKYCDDEITGQKYERMLLFDRINSAVLDISRSFTDPFPSVKPVKVGFGSKWQKSYVRDELYKLLGIQEKEANEGISVNLLDKEMYWPDLRDSIDMIGMEIENLLIDDLITELVTM